MKITRRQLRQIIKEELSRHVTEIVSGPGGDQWEDPDTGETHYTQYKRADHWGSDALEASMEPDYRHDVEKWFDDGVLSADELRKLANVLDSEKEREEIPLIQELPPERAARWPGFEDHHVQLKGRPDKWLRKDYDPESEEYGSIISKLT